MSEQTGSELYDILRECHLFKRLTDQQVADLAEEMSIESVAESNVIFQQGDEARYFYFVLGGRVRVALLDDRQEFEIGILDDGDYFGHDALVLHGYNAYSTYAITDVTLALLSHDQYRSLINRYPVLERSFELIYKSYRLPQQTDFSWRAPRETIHYISRKHPFFLLIKLLLPLTLIAVSAAFWVVFFTANQSGFLLVLSGLLTAGGLGWLLWNWLDWTNDYAIITNRRVIYQERVVLMYESQQEAPLEAILSDDITSTQWGRWFGYGNVVVRTFTGSLILPRVENPREVKMILAERRLRSTSRGRQTRQQVMQSVIRRRLGGDENAQIPTEDTLLPPRVKMGALQSALNDLLLMRWERGDAIIYRTHWLVLFSKIAVPSGVGLFLIALILWGAIRQNFITTPLFLITLLLVLVADSLFWIYRFWDWTNDQYIITPAELVDVYKKPLGKEERRSAPLESIQSINHERKNLIALIFNYGTVFVRVGDDMLTFDNVPDPANVQREIFDRFWQRKQLKEKRAADEEQERMVEWLEAYHAVRQQPDINDVEGDG